MLISKCILPIYYIVLMSVITRFAPSPT